MREIPHLSRLYQQSILNFHYLFFAFLYIYLCGRIVARIFPRPKFSKLHSSYLDSMVISRVLESCEKHMRGLIRCMYNFQNHIIQTARKDAPRQWELTACKTRRDTPTVVYRHAKTAPRVYTYTHSLYIKFAWDDSLQNMHYAL